MKKGHMKMVKNYQKYRIKKKNTLYSYMATPELKYLANNERKSSLASHKLIKGGEKC